MGLSKAVVKNRVLILMIALILLVPAVFPDWEKPPTLLGPVSSSPPEVVSSAHTS